MADRVGQQLGNYRLVRLLGRGGFAEVYLAEHRRLGTMAAVKVLYTRLGSQDEVTGFEKEARTIAHLRHPHIVRVLDFDVEEETPFLVMDYAPNGTLRRRHPRGSVLPLATIVSYVRQVADALQYAHDQRLVHRDVKPENMLIGERDEILLSDFGIAVVAQSSRYQNTQDMAGTIAYMAPEQIQAHPRPASDQYSLGIVVYEWLSGDRPFHGSFTEIAAKHTITPPPPLREKLPTLSPDIEQIVTTALAKDHRARFGSVRAFANALEQAWQAEQNATHAPTILNTMPPPAGTPAPTASTLQGLSIPALPVPDIAPSPSTPQPLTTPVTSPSPPSIAGAQDTPSPARPIAISPKTETTPPIAPRQGISRRTVLLGLGGLVVVGGGGITLWVLSQTLPGTTFYVYRGHSSAVVAVAWSPDGTRIASASWDGTVQVWDATTGGNAYTYRGHSSAVNAVAWSPDGTRIASGGDDKTVQVWDATTGGNAYTYRGHSSDVYAVAWSPDGTRIASGGDDKTVQVWDATTGGNAYTYRGHSDYVWAVAWSPDGTRIASGSDDTTVQVWDATTGGNAYTYRGHSGYVNAVAWSPDGTRIASGSGDRTVQVWDATTGGNAYTYRGHSNSIVRAVAWSPDGTRIASGGHDNTVRVWSAT